MPSSRGVGGVGTGAVVVLVVVVVVVMIVEGVDDGGGGCRERKGGGGERAQPHAFGLPSLRGYCVAPTGV
jgi:hypothetical protein